MSLRERCLAGLRKTVQDGFPLLGVGAGTGISAKFADYIRQISTLVLSRQNCLVGRAVAVSYLASTLRGGAK